nr:hypothetical protein [Tanacetum cinerariifolium]
MTKALLIPKYQDYQTQHVLIIGTSQSRQHGKSEPRSPVIPRRRVMILAPGQPISHGRPYRYHPNGPVYMMTARKRVRPLPVHQLSVRHTVDHSSSDPSSRHSSSDHSSPDSQSTSAGPSRKRRRDIGYLADVEVNPRETKVERVVHPTMPEDIPEPAQEGAVETTEGIQKEQGCRIVRVESAVTVLTERVVELEWNNQRLRGTASVKSQRVDRLQCGMSCMQREMRQLRQFRFFDRVRVGRLEACAGKHMVYRP